MRRLLACLLCAVALQATASAHVLDQYLQVAQISLARDGVRVDLHLVPGVEVADRVFALIDLDGDGQISSAEGQAYARRVLTDVTLEVDGRRAPLALKGIEFPSRREMNEGVGAIRFDLAAEADLGTAGEHRLSFRNDHLPELGAYLVNALFPATDVFKITGQQRDTLQHALRVDFIATSPESPTWPRRLGVLLSALLLALLLTRWKRLRELLTTSTQRHSFKF
jgi:hypothetical protein